MKKTKTEKNEKAAERHLHLFVYQGLRLQGLGLERKGVHVWSPLECKDAVLPMNPKMSVFLKPLQKRATPGCIYLMAGDKTGEHVFINSGVFQGRYAEEDKTVQWAAEHRGAIAELAIQRDTAQKIRKELDLERLKPFRLTYSRASSVQRGLILSNIVKYIVEGALL